MEAIATPLPSRRAVRNSTVTRQYVGPADVVEMTGLSETTVRRALAAGQLEGFVVGRRWLIPIDAVDAWVRSN